MDLGATICTPRNPTCGICPIANLCKAHCAGVQADLPRKSPKPEKPTRHGLVWIARRHDGAYLLETRPARGLLGGMLGWPGNDWDKGGGPAPLAADWAEAGVLRHTFTHFHLHLTVLTAKSDGARPPLRGTFLPQNRFSRADLPTVMRKAHDLAAAALGHS